MWKCRCGSENIRVTMKPCLNQDGTYECCESEHLDYWCEDCGDTSEFIDDIAEKGEQCTGI